MEIIEVKCENCNKEIYINREQVREKMFCTLGVWIPIKVPPQQKDFTKKLINYLCILGGMIVSMTLELKDIPGQLVLALSPISEFQGNIMSVVHQHDEKTPRGQYPYR